MKRLKSVLIPPGEWKLTVVILCGIICGMTFFIFHISKAGSYLSDNPETCINCHVMNPEFVSWYHSSHRRVAVCNDCHVPHDNLVNKYFFKAKDGLRHATIFTLRAEPQVIRIKESGTKVVQGNCVRCHGTLFDDLDDFSPDQVAIMNADGRNCWDCHRETPHGRVTSLSSVPNENTIQDKK